MLSFKFMSVNGIMRHVHRSICSVLHYVGLHRSIVKY